MLNTRTYEKMIPRRDRSALEQALGMTGGYVLDFTDKTFDEFFYEVVKIDPDDKPELFNGRGSSKAKRLRSFIERADTALVVKVLRELWEHRIGTLHSNSDETELHNSYFGIVAKLEGSVDFIDISAIEMFEPNETLEELVASIRRDLEAKKPQAGLDRLHVYCMKRFASLIRKHGGEECGKEEALHARVGKYVKLLREQRNLTPMTERIVRSSISVFQEMNPIRNNQSFAHDNPDLVDMDEARFIFDSVTAFLRFSKAIDGRYFEG